MGPLRLLMIALALAAGGPAGAAPVGRWSGHIAEASRSFGIPESWIRRVMQAESGGRTSLGGRPIVSRAGAMGLMQLMPATWREMRALLGLGADPHDPRDNILAGAAYLRMMYDRFGHPGLFAAYNAGPARYAEHLRSGRRLPGETVAYVSAVTGRTNSRAAPLSQGGATALFAIRSAPEPANSLQTGRPAWISNPLFVPLSSAGSR
jgi:soluble lytic murein transglycosylase-like protein